MTETGEDVVDTDKPATRLRPTGIWLSVVANGIGACGGAIFFVARPGDRFRGMEPEAAAFTMLVLLAMLLGLCGGLPLSIRDLFWRRMWLWGLLGTVLALMPVVTANFVSDVAAWHLGLIWD